MDSTELSSMNNQTGLDWKEILSSSSAVILGYLPIGFAYGVLGINAGLTVAQVVLMSVIVLAGSAQLIAVSLFALQITPLSIITTTFFVNLRHMLMSAALSPFLKSWKGYQVGLFSFGITDETFAVHSLRFSQNKTEPKQAVLINLTCQLAWVSGSLLGAFAGNMIGDVRKFALDFALPAMFIALLILQIRHRHHIIIALIAALMSIIFWQIGATQWHVIIASVLAALIGAGVDAWKK